VSGARVKVLAFGRMADRALPQQSVVPMAVLRLAPLLAALLAVAAAGILYSSTAIAPAQTLRILLAGVGLYTGHRTWPAADALIIWQLRVPRVAAAALVGGALAVAGALYQAVLRNPLADPYVIGTAAGAQLGMIAALLLPVQVALLGFGTLQVFAFITASLTVLVVYGLARTGGRTPIVTLLLAGFVLSSFLISASTFLMMISNRIEQAMQWTMGSLDVSEMTQLTVVGPVILFLVAGSVLLARPLDVMMLGEEQAGHLGIHVERLKLVAVVVATLLTALAVTLAGIVAFVGLVAPHAIRLIYGPGHRLLLPSSALVGATFVVGADLISRVALAPVPIPLSIVTAVIGAPLFLHLLRRSKRTYSV